MIIDTETTEGKIKVQQAHLDGKDIVMEDGKGELFTLPKKDGHNWDWQRNRYFIRPERVCQAATKYACSIMRSPLSHELVTAFEAGVQWLKDQSK